MVAGGGGGPGAEEAGPRQPALARQLQASRLPAVPAAAAAQCYVVMTTTWPRSTLTWVAAMNSR